MNPTHRHGLHRGTQLAAVVLAVLLLVPILPGTALACRPGAVGVARTVEIDAAGGPVYGRMSRAAKAPSFLGPKEVVLTFDDGPMPWVTGEILDTLDDHCTRASFCSVGRMAIAYPEHVREILRRGHTLGSHTWSHPLNLATISPERAITEIERGHAAVALAAGRPIAPFFRFPGLSDSAVLIAHLQRRGMATFTVDVVSNDSFIADPARLARLTLERIEERQGGIILFHDIKRSTAKALPEILRQLAVRGYRVVHVKAASTAEPVKDHDAELGRMLARVEVAAGARRTLQTGRDAAGGARAAEAWRPTMRRSGEAAVRRVDDGSGGVAADLRPGF